MCTQQCLQSNGIKVVSSDNKSTTKRNITGVGKATGLKLYVSMFYLLLCSLVRLQQSAHLLMYVHIKQTIYIQTQTPTV